MVSYQILLAQIMIAIPMWRSTISLKKNKEHKLVGYHTCNSQTIYGDWRIMPHDNIWIDLSRIPHLLTEDKIEMVNHKYICWKGMDDLELVNTSQRFYDCDITFPCILIEKIRNPKQMRYRMIDGRHRMTKMWSLNIFESLFYVLQKKDIAKYFEWDVRKL